MKELLAFLIGASCIGLDIYLVLDGKPLHDALLA